ncbi:MAG: 2-phospho-L-lactate transferase [Acidimicrobiales bacterium]
MTRVIVALAGGVGAARMLSALSAVVDPASLTAVVNTGDDTVLHGLAISPDLDTVVYTLAGAINADTGWGLTDETWRAMETLRAYGGERLAWFNLGDRDLGTHLYRTSRLAEGATLSTVTAEIARMWGLSLRILPMSDDRVATRVTVPVTGADERVRPPVDQTVEAAVEETVEEIGFQEYFVARRHAVSVRAVRLEGIEAAKPAPDVLASIASAEGVVICPSNPIVSIAPVLAVDGLGAAVSGRREQVVGVSPIIAGRALKGPADRLLAELGHEPSVVGVARLWAPYAATLVVDPADEDRAGDVEAAGMRCVVAPSIMSTPDAAAALGRTVLDALGVRP